MKKTKQTSNTSKSKRIFRVVTKSFLYLILFFVLLVLFIRSPWGQNSIINQLTNYVSNKTSTEFSIQHFYLSFDGNLVLDEVFLADQNKDTLLYSKLLEIDIPLLPIFTKQQIQIEELLWHGAKANIYRKQNEQDFNYQFLIDAFTQEDTKDDQNDNAYTFSLGNINLENLNLVYNDENEKLSTQLVLGKASLNFSEFDLPNQIFQLKEVSLSDTDFTFNQGESKNQGAELNSNSSQNESNILPQFMIEYLSIENVNVAFSDAANQMQTKSEIGKFNMNKTSIDIQHNSFEFDLLYLANSSFQIDLPAIENNTNTSDENQDFTWPAYLLKLKHLQFENNQFEFTQNQKKIASGVFEADAIYLNQLDLDLSDVNFSSDEKASLKLNHFRFVESSGVQLKEFSFDLAIDPKGISVDKLKVATQQNQLSGMLQLNYEELTNWLNNPSAFQNSAINLEGNLNLSEALKFDSSLTELPYFTEFVQHNIQFQIQSNGNLKAHTISKLNAAWSSTKLSAAGELFSLNNIENFRYRLNNYAVSSSQNDYSKFIDTSSQDSFNFPLKVSITGNAKGSLNQIITKSRVRIPEGELTIDAEVQQGDQIKLNTQLNLLQLDVGKLVNQPDLKPISLQIKTKIEGKDWLELKGEFNSKIDTLQYAAMDFSDLEFSGSIENENVEILAGIKNDVIDFNSIAQLSLDSLQPEANLNVNLKGIDLKQFGLSSRNIRAKANLQANLLGNREDFKLTSTIDSTVVVYEDERFYVGKVALNAEVNPDLSRATIASKFVDSQLEANASPDRILASLQNYFKSFFDDVSTIETYSKTSQNPVNLDFSLRFHETPFISRVLLEGIQELDTLTLDVSFKEEQKQFTSQINFPKLVYNNNELYNLYFNFDAHKSNADFDLGFTSLKAGAFEVSETKFFGNWNQDEVLVNFEAYNEEEQLFNINTETAIEEEQITFTINPSQLILNGKPWDVPTTNAAIYRKNSATNPLQFSDLELSRKQQKIAFRTDFDIEGNHAGIAFSDFKLSTFTNYITTDEEFLNGIISGDLVLVNLFQKIGVISDLSIADLRYKNTLLGNLNLKATSNLENTYQLNLAISGEQIQLAAEGKIDHSTPLTTYSSSIDIEKINVQLIEEFSSDFITDTKGQLAATFNLSGTANELDYKGNITFSDTEFRSKDLNTIFKLGNERIEVTNNKIKFNNFTLKDVNDNALNINGDIGMAELTNPKFNLQAKATNFQLLNSTKKDNDLYFGKINFDTDFKLLGDLNFPKIVGDLSINEATDITYIVPESQVGTVEREGVVLFVNKKNPDDILTKQNKDKYNVLVSGIEIKAQLDIHPKTKAKVVFNKKTGDNVSLVGGGKLNYNLAKNGDQSLSGKYQVASGELELNLYNLVTRRFQIANQSSISWYGDPYNADLDIRAIYNIETSASSLMASQISSESAAVQNQFRQQLPFQVYLDVDGEIASPQLNFQLDMPESQRAAVNGAVYSRVSQINQQEDELNKQVFSLLVLNRFYPTSGSDGSQGGAASLARNNINQALSDQLNTYANKLTGNTGIELNFDVNSYTDFQSGRANNRTDVDIRAQKKLLDDRLVLEAGSQVNVEGDLRPGEQNVALGNISVQYILTPDGRWKIKGFRRSEYENVIDGQVFISGIALIFTREFNRFKELWAKGFMKASE